MSDFTNPGEALAEAITAASYIGARLVMDMEPMTRLFEIMPMADVIRFSTHQLEGLQWEITLYREAPDLTPPPQGNG